MNLCTYTLLSNVHTFDKTKFLVRRYVLIIIVGCDTIDFYSRSLQTTFKIQPTGTQIGLFGALSTDQINYERALVSVFGAFKFSLSNFHWIFAVGKEYKSNLRVWYTPKIIAFPKVLSCICGKEKKKNIKLIREETFLQLSDMWQLLRFLHSPFSQVTWSARVVSEFLSHVCQSPVTRHA